MPDHGAIYTQQAERYHELIAKQPSLKSIIEEIRPVAGLDVVDLGAGSGRLAAVLAGQARSIVALDAQAAMLEVAAKRLAQAGYTNWSTSVADHRSLPLENDSADLVVSGWSIGYLGSDTLANWEDNIRQVMSEIKRVLRPGGTAILFETMGTGFETPNPPRFLKPYFHALERHYGFSYRWVRMDYDFDSVDQAEQLARFFFSDELADRIVEQQLIRLPECAGIWWLQL
ncbi:ubiquinone/menaquinone biosynthesis C-methylase UbiE [Paenibacillus endophyticus]|uniref:Ubiquinone/menaquinone biosynthesis C-methylase UbiE n=1 Tax=Paenibacillus endophyticus TaxID=1294268 RepID=A0A7W5C8P2_9BACL|nr:class I SAM-dependent methyltransferase [Paenibacillus endophyticus]MBB3152790.1 ubiquinone/menaquinone biosynthesis C-methylase UbiE [Paenibacillus endophyticus]